MKTAHRFVSDIAEHVSMPEVYVAIRELLLNTITTIDDFVAVVERDSMLAVRVMRFARSEYFGVPRRCENLYQAISLIGLMQLHDLLLGTLCMRIFDGISKPIFNLESFWRYSIRCGIAARTIGQHSRMGNHHAFFTLGLLHEIGHGMLYLKAPGLALQALDASQNENRDLAEVEQELFGFDYGQVGAELMRLWLLPSDYQQAAAYHRQPQLADRRYRAAVEVVHLAHVICQDPRSGQHATAIERGITEVGEFKHLPRQIDELVIGEIEAHGDAVLGLLWPHSNPQAPESERWQFDA